MQKLKVLTEELKLNNITHNVPVVITWDYEDYLPDQDEVDATKAIESGELVCITICVKSKFTCEEGFDSLGRCFVRGSHFEQDIMETVKDYSMIENSMNDLKENLFKCFNQMRQAMGQH